MDLNALYPLEGHRPVIRYIMAMQETELETATPDIGRLVSMGIIESNPHQILEDSSLLQLTVAQKLGPFRKSQ